jgi:NADH dehydrogenase FAD-containing subunit
MATQSALFDPETIGTLADAITERILPQIVETVRAEAVDALAGETIHLPTRSTVDDCSAELRSLREEIIAFRQTLETVVGLWTPGKAVA